MQDEKRDGEKRRTAGNFLRARREVRDSVEAAVAMCACTHREHEAGGSSSEEKLHGMSVASALGNRGIFAGRPEEIRWVKLDTTPR